MNAHASIVKHSLIQIAGRALGIVFGLFTLAIMARALGDEGYGVYTTAITYLQLWAIVADVGLTLTFSQMISEPGADEKRIVGALFTLRLLLAGAVLAAGIAALFLTSYDPLTRAAILAGTLGYLSLSATAMVTGIFQKHLVMQRAVVSEMIQRVLALALIAWIAWRGLGVVPMMWAASISNLVQLLATIWLAFRYVRLVPRIDVTIWKRALSLSWPIGLSIFFNMLYLRSDVLILSAYEPISEVGIYGAGYRVIDVVTALPTMFMGIALPVFVRLWKERAMPELHALLQNIFDLFCLVAFPLAVGSMFIATPIMTLIAGPEFARSGPILMILILAAIPLFVSAMFGHVIVAIDRQRAILSAYAGTAVVAFLLYFTLIPRFGIFGAAWSTVAAEALIACLTGAMVMRTLSYRPHLSIIIKACLATAIMAVVLFLLPAVSTILVVATGIGVYAASLLLLGVRTSVKNLLGLTA